MGAVVVEGAETVLVRLGDDTALVMTVGFLSAGLTDDDVNILGLFWYGEIPVGVRVPGNRYTDEGRVCV